VNVKIRRIAACAALAWLLLTPTRALSETAVEDFIRLHVVARSNSAWDQGVKLAVRDAVREETAALLQACADADEAWALLQARLDAVESAAQAALSEWDADCALRVTAETCAFPERTYGGLTVPAGEYRAVRVILGEGAGRNWWCVLFPSLCLPRDADEATPVIFYSSLGRWLAGLFGGRAQ